MNSFLTFLSVTVLSGTTLAQTGDFLFQLGASGTIVDVVYDGEDFAAINSNGPSLVSPDGVNWDLVELDTSIFGTLGETVFGDGRYVTSRQSFSAGGTWVSTDLMTWSSENGPEQDGAIVGIDRIAYNDGRFVGSTVTGARGLFHSTNGADWTAAIVPSESPATRVFAADNFFVAFVFGENRFISSPDGMRWSETRVVDTSGTPVEVRSLLAGARDGSDFIVLTRDSILRSSNGITWTSVDFRTAPNLSTFSDLAVSGGVYVATSLLDSAVYRSTDGGVNWSPIQINDNEEIIEFTDIESGEGRFVLSGGRGGIYESTDGLDWTLQVGTGPRRQSNSPAEITFQGGLFLGMEPRSIQSSEVGIVWDVAIELGNEVLFPRSVLFADDRWVVVGNSGYIASGDELGNMEVRRTDEDGSIDYFIEDIAYGNGRWVAATRASSSRPLAFITSKDSINWTDLTSIPSVFAQTIDFGNGVFLATSGRQESFLKSSDGLSWTEEVLADLAFSDPNETFDRIGRVMFLNDRFVNINRNQVYSSIDGSEWTLESIVPQVVIGMAYDPVSEIYMTIAPQDGRYFISNDLAGPWTEGNIPKTGPLTQIAAGGSVFTVVNNSGQTFVASPPVPAGLGISLVDATTALLEWSAGPADPQTIHLNDDLSGGWAPAVVSNPTRNGNDRSVEVEVDSSIPARFFRLQLED